ncbi:MAG: Holliday junction resolvase RuvX [bacterium]|nr:Holliday junction resolvase RuvX [bacterium]
MRIMGIDYGEKRVGIAISDEECKIAFPTTVLQNDKELPKQVAELCDVNKCGSVVIGESSDLNGVPNPIAEKIEKFKNNLRTYMKKPIHMEPEFFTSIQAERIQGKTTMQDASAAALILQSYLDKTRNM